MRSPLAKRRVLALAGQRGLSQRRACRVLGLSRRVACYQLRQPEKDRPLGEQLMATSQRFPRFGYRRAAAWLSLGETRTRRLWRLLGLQLPKRRPRRRRTGSDIRLPGAVTPNAVWTYDFIHDRLASGTALKLLCVLDEHTRECLAIEVGRWIRRDENARARNARSRQPSTAAWFTRFSATPESRQSARFCSSSVRPNRSAASFSPRCRAWLAAVPYAAIS